ncbi:glucosamine inositolphosphorylceramide transferase family protein [Roseomonas xinghualingensis]|uniref:glucosamine inositolphosphorylceramide transferase family protein n=1 Tax=Roseomonas xinghualingensis TaxID=2986475 RepID=UPI0021F2393E|nr:hypothetical protein [Roseomonas sp. SXEYE001]MCV4210129.1 hypothetical protein [Roseomonas sp. SXEYE001]
MIGPRDCLYEPVQLVAPQLRVGILLDAPKAERWVRSVLTDIQEAPFTQIALVVLNDEAPAPPPRRSGAGMWAAHLEGQMFWQYAKRDQRNQRNGSVLAHTNVADLLAEVPRLRVRPARKGFVHRFADGDLAAIQGHDLDVLLRFGFNVLRGGILHAARHGVWSFHHGDNSAYRGGPAMFWEIAERNPVTGTILQVLTDELDGGEVIYRSWGATGRSMWMSSSREPLYRKASPFVIRCLRQLYQRGGEPLPVEAPGAKGHLYRKPTNAQMAPFLARAALRSLRSRVANRLGQEEWFLAYRHEREKFVTNTARVDMSGFVPMRPPAHEFWADPFVLKHESTDHVFFERYDRQAGRGDIWTFAFDSAGRPGSMRPVLSLSHHLSSPFVFEWEGRAYMVPESAEVRTVSLYRATRFPDGWEHVCDLLSGVPVVDANLFEHEGRWYLFANASEDGGPLDDELFLFHAETPLGPWRPHPMNPIKSDVRSARPAGRIFRRGGVLIRPSQDCSVRYGYAINLCEIRALSPTAYEERVIDRITPDWLPGLMCCHTINATDTVEVVDAKRRAARGWRPLRA